MELIIDNINWLAVIVGAVAAFALGALWYSPKMFGKKWMEGVGLKVEDAKMGAAPMIAQGVGTFLLAWVISVTMVSNNIMFAILIALTIAVIIKSNGLWANKSMYAIKVESGFILVMVAVMVAAHVIF